METQENKQAQVEEQKQPQAESTQPTLEERLKQLDGSENEEVKTEEKESSSSLPDLSELGEPEVKPEETKEEPVQEEGLGLPDTPEAKKFAEDFKQYLGFDISELRTGVQELQTYRQQLEQERQQAAQQQEMSKLQKEWGLEQGEFDTRLNAVIERFNKYSPEMQARLDSVEGAKLIWAKLEQEAKDSGVPAFQKSSSGAVSGGKQPMFTRTEIASMSKEEYSRNADRILKAYQLGLVDNSR